MPTRCVEPQSVHLSGTLAAGGGGPGISTKFSGILTDVVMRRTVAYTTTDLSGGAGLGAGIYDVKGTLRGGFRALSKPFSIGFTYVGYGPFSVGVATIGNGSGPIGKIDVSGKVQTPAEACLLSFAGVTLVPNGTSC